MKYIRSINSVNRIITVEPKIVREDEPLSWLNWAGHLVAEGFSDEYKDLDSRHFSVSNRRD